jgi:hypothetical protein
MGQCAEGLLCIALVIIAVWVLWYFDSPEGRKLLVFLAGG